MTGTAVGRVGRHVLLAVLVALWLVPTWLVVVNAFTPSLKYTGSPSWWFKSGAILDNIRDAFTAADVGRGMVNSLIYAALGGLLSVVIAAMASFAVVIMPVRRPTLWFWVIFIGTVLPLQTFLSPLFTGYAKTSLYDTQYGMLLVYIALAIPFAFFVSRNFFVTVPREMREAAELDGAGWWRMFVGVHLPLARGALMAAFMFQFTWVWNDLLFGITLSLSPNVRPVMATLADLNGNYSTVGPPAVLAGALVASLPTVILFFAFQRFFVNNLRLTS